MVKVMTSSSSWATERSREAQDKLMVSASIGAFPTCDNDRGQVVANLKTPVHGELAPVCTLFTHEMNKTRKLLLKTGQTRLSGLANQMVWFRQLR
jgi:hypothetical protein